MNPSKLNADEQAKPFTHGLARALVRQHAYQLFREKIPRQPLTLEDWVLAEKAVVAEQMAEAARINLSTLDAVSARAKHP